MRRDYFLIAFSVCVFGISCKKGADDELVKKDPREFNKYSSVSRLAYSENLFYVSQKKASNIISPVSKPDFEGHFTSIPAGLDIDRKTGIIDLGKSQPGQPYKIFYVNKKGILKDSVRIVISGLDYLDGIYDSENSKSTFGQKSTALYSGDQAAPISSNFFNSFSVSYQAEEDDSEDETGLSINKKNGSLDLKNSKSSGLFGKKPTDGAYQELVIKYRLADKSARKLNLQKVKFYFFKEEKKIPASLRVVIGDRKRIMDRVNAMPTPGNTSTEIDIVETLEESLSEYSKPVRPPIIIVI